MLSTSRLTLRPLQHRRNDLILLFYFYLFTYLVCVCVCVLGKERQRERDRQTKREAIAHMWKRKDSFPELVIFFLPSITWVLWTELKSSGQFHGASSATQPESLHSTRQSHNLPCVSPPPCARFGVNSPHECIGPLLMEPIEKIRAESSLKRIWCH